jgi:hypothetical protein
MPNLLEGFADWQMLIAIGDITGAAMCLITTTLRYAINYLLVYPTIQTKIHAEIDENVGRDRELSMDDQKSLPYLCAYIQVFDANICAKNANNI